MKIAVIALGKIGLPLAVQFADKGHEVVGVDVSQHTVDLVNQGVEPFPGEAHLQEKLSELVPAGKLRATTDYRSVAELDTVNICVPTPLRKTKDPDMSFVVSAVEAIAEYLHPGMLVILESTTYPGTTEELVQPLLERTGAVVTADGVGGVDYTSEPDGVPPAFWAWTAPQS